MKKSITILSVLAITTTITPTIVACSTPELNLNSLTADSFKQLDTIDGFSMNKKDISEINDDQELIKAVKDHIKTMILKKVFDLKSFLITWTEKERERLDAFNTFWNSTTPAILNINIEIIEPNKKYQITITKEKWEKIKIDTTLDTSVSRKIIKSYYDLIKGDNVTIIINK